MGSHSKPGAADPEAGKPKIPPVAKGLLERGLMLLDTSQHVPRLFFTEARVASLRRMMSDRRLVDAKKFAHVRQEHGIDPMPTKEAPQIEPAASGTSGAGAVGVNDCG
jgi:hypothetical protein